METERLQERITKLEMCLYGIEQSNLNPHAKNQSFEISELATAFPKAQAEYGTILQNRTNPFFKSKYADLNAILKAIRPSLVKHGLSFYQYTSVDSGDTILHSRIMHASGQWLESQTKISPSKSDIQSYGSTMSYQRRYSALTILGVATSDDPADDDGNIVTPQTISDAQWSILNDALKNKKSILPVILKKLNIKSLSDMLKPDYSRILDGIKKYEEKK